MICQLRLALRCLLLAALCALPGAIRAQMPENMVAFVKSEEGCPALGTQWGAMTEAWGRFLLPVVVPNPGGEDDGAETTACTNGGPLSACIGQGLGTNMAFQKEQRQYQASAHQHGYKVSVSAKKKKSTVAYRADGFPFMVKAGTYVDKSTTVPVTGAEGTNANVGFIQFPVCQFQGKTTAADAMPIGSIAFFNSKKECPPNWGPFIHGNGRFLVSPESTAKLYVRSAAGWTDGEKLNYSTMADHHHAISSKIEVDSVKLSHGIRSNCTANYETFKLTGRTDPIAAGQPMLPFVPLLGCQKTTEPNETTTKIPVGLIAFFLQPQCDVESGWQRIDAPNQFFVGAPGNALAAGNSAGDNLAPSSTGVLNYPHRHQVAGKISGGKCDTMIERGLYHFAKYKHQKRHFAYETLTHSATSPDVPLQQVAACQYIGN